MNKTEFTLEEIKNDCSDLELRILELYLERRKQKEICELLNIKRGAIDTLVKKYKLTRFRDRANYTINVNALNRNNPDIWYVLGLFASDGNIYDMEKCTRVQFCLDDEEVLYHIKEILGFTGEVKKYFKSGKDRYQLMITNSKLVSFLEEIFNQDCRRKTETLLFPENIPSEECMIMFLRGFIEGDGSFRAHSDSKYYRFSIYCKSKNFILKLKNIIENIIGRECSFYNNSTIELSSKKDNYKLYKFLYEKFENKYFMNRKYERAKAHIIAYENELKI